MSHTECSSPSARERLRVETRSLHSQLDALLGELRPFENVERYAIYLAGMRELYAAFGSACDRCAELSHLAPQGDEMIRSLDADLQSCGAALGDTHCLQSNHALNDSGNWGAAYVLEGSAMGAQMLVRSAREKLVPQVTVHFLTALAGEGVGRFRTFCAALEAAGANADEAVAAAKAVFRHATETYRLRLTGLKQAGENHIAT